MGGEGVNSSSSRAAIMAFLTRILKDECDRSEEISDASHIIRDLGLDSVNQLTLAVEVENHFKILLDEGEHPPQTIGELIRLIQKRTEQNAGGEEIGHS